MTGAAVISDAGFAGDYFLSMEVRGSRHAAPAAGRYAVNAGGPGAGTVVRSMTDRCRLLLIPGRNRLVGIVRKVPEKNCLIAIMVILLPEGCLRRYIE